MILYEYEGKQILFQNGVDIPVHELLTSPNQEVVVKPPLVLKAQVLSGKRAEVGGIVMMDDEKDLRRELEDLFGEVINKEKVEKVLAEEKIHFDKEFYLAISYDTDFRAPILTFSQEGGTGIEERQAHIFPIDPLTSAILASKEGMEWTSDQLGEKGLTALGEKLVNIFFEHDMTLLEINPLVKTEDGRWVALDAKIKLDDDAKKRHPEWEFSPRSAPGYTPTDREIEAKKIDEGDYRGTAGSAYFDLPGDIAILSSGGGVSLTAMDALTSFGGKPANFTEYSGNPPKEKVVKLTKIVLNKPNLHGLWVIGTVAANFTDIYETLSGFIEGLREAEKELDTKFNFPIVIRRGGPNAEKAYQMLMEIKDFNITLQGPETSITESAKIMAEKAREYAER
jgi:citryl-CoA synthetase large subunit